MSMLGWSSLSVQRPEEKRIEKEGGKGGERDGSTKRKLHLAKMPCRVKSITDTRKERQLNPNRPWVL